MKKPLILLLSLSLFAACGQKQQTGTSTDTSSVAAADTAKSVTSLPGPVANTILTDEYVKHLASFVYLWGWPMVNIHTRDPG